jgi:phosphatidylserine decarboxylase
MVSGIPLPKPLRDPVFGSIALRMGIDMEEAAEAVPEYRCFRELFVRPLRDGLRPLDGAEDAIVNPVDGCVAGFGTARRGGMIQAKGIEYSLAELLASRELADELDGGTYVTLYLRPHDYHRIHCPLAATVEGLCHVGGRLFPVQPSVVRGIRGLYVRNERVVFDLETAIGRVSMVCVAAAGVGNITTSWGLPSGSNGERLQVRAKVAKGQEMARFNLGSTVIVVFPPGKVELVPLVPGQEIRMGRRVASVRQSTR